MFHCVPSGDQNSIVDSSSIRKFAPRRLDKFDYLPSIDALSSILVLWNSAIFAGLTIDKLLFGLTMAFTSNLSVETWKLTTIYGPCVEPERSEFVAWLKSHSIEDDENWLFLGDFNFYRSLEDRNQPGGNLQHTLIFNDIIGHLGLIELPLKGMAYTWSNMQQNPLLEQLDWFFTSVNWTLAFPNTMVLPLAKVTSDHIPCKIVIGTSIPKSNIFSFENVWPEHPGFL
jgi:hypothetical protein